MCFLYLKKKNRVEQDGRGVGGCGVHLSPRIHQEYTIRPRSACRTPAKRGQEFLTSRKEYIDPHKLGRRKELGGKTSVSWPGPALGREAELKQGSDPHIREIESEEKHLRLRVKQLICGSLHGMRIRQSLLQPCIPWTGKQVPWS